MIDGLSIAKHLVRHDYFKRPYYAYGLLLATIEAQHMGLKSLTVMEFGVFNGGGLLEMCDITEHLTKLTEFTYKIVGFDHGGGLLGITSVRDHPEIWSNGQFPMYNKAELLEQLAGRAEVVFGDVCNTVPSYLGSELRVDAPLGFVALDVDTYTASSNSLKIFLGSNPAYYLPAVPMYVDDVNELLTYNQWCGEELSIAEFNEISDSRKIQKKLARPSSEPRAWHNHYYVFHCLDHQIRMGNGLRKPFEINVDMY